MGALIDLWPFARRALGWTAREISAGSAYRRNAADIDHCERPTRSADLRLTQAVHSVQTNHRRPVRLPRLHPCRPLRDWELDHHR